LLCLREATSKGWGGREKEKGRGKGPPFRVGIEPPVGLIQQWVQDGAIVTMETVPKLSNSTNFVTHISRSRYYLTLNISETVQDTDINVYNEILIGT